MARRVMQAQSADAPDAVRARRTHHACAGASRTQAPCCLGLVAPAPLPGRTRTRPGVWLAGGSDYWGGGLSDQEGLRLLRGVIIYSSI